MSSMSSFRGGYAPRRGRGGWSKTPFVKQKREHTKPDTNKHPLGELLKTIENSDLKSQPSALPADALTSDVRYVASYNWRNDVGATILVPGKPPLWTPLKEAQRLNEDNGIYYRDPNAARSPDYPITPVVQAVLETNPNFDTADVDIVACGSTLGNLLRFVRGQDKPFRFMVETIGNSVFFVRKENDPKETIDGVRGFGHSFPEAYTTWEPEVKGSEAHQRVIQYKFGGMTCMIRFECDGYLKDKITDGKHGTDVLDKPKSNGDDLLSAFNKTAITQPLMNQGSGTERVKIKRGGSEIPQRSIFDLKTRSGKYKTDIDMSDILPQLWVKQVPNFIVAYHDGAGLFRDIRVQDVRTEVHKWEEDNIDAIRRLAVLLKKLVTFAREDGGLLEVYSPGTDRLEVRKQHGQGKNALPHSLRDEWASKSKANMYLSDSDDGGYTLKDGYDSDGGWKADSEDEEPDYTACSAEDCGYCGKCTY
ncbi:hypothetical protein CC86DRAFT_305106 [Ophiobolus disseminans]|uniref:Geranylgeranyl pyrophosphate synthetase n=1 Tax=Ophiobolus disseminans TaxID=1469910 RepID=A0A6A6ZH98_9PLEO|nr:hypothetical protein CC86DRAFT_305106 [Ophiobolus disseminans]